VGGRGTVSSFVCKGNMCDLYVLPFGESTSRCALLHRNLPSGKAEVRCALPHYNLPLREPKFQCPVPFCTAKADRLQLLTCLLCCAQFSTAAVHAAEEQREAASKEAKRQELFPSLSSSSSATRPAQSTGESPPISHSQSVIPNES